jgi:hypothetical protein
MLGYILQYYFYHEKSCSRKWSEIAFYIPGRVGKQCRERWLNHMDPDVKKTEWTPEEDKILVEGQALHGNKWSTISKLLTGRSENSVKNRWNSMINKTKGTASITPGFSPQIPEKRKYTKSKSKYLDDFSVDYFISENLKAETNNVLYPSDTFDGLFEMEPSDWQLYESFEKSLYGTSMPSMHHASFSANNEEDIVTGVPNTEVSALETINESQNVTFHRNSLHAGSGSGLINFKAKRVSADTSFYFLEQAPTNIKKSSDLQVNEDFEFDFESMINV